MVIHTIVAEYDLLYAQEREMSFALSAVGAVPFSTLPNTKLTELLTASYYPQEILSQMKGVSDLTRTTFEL